MKRVIRRTAGLGIIVCIFALVGCGLFDSGTEWKGGPYELLWIDTKEKMSIDYQLTKSTSVGRIASTVFAVGWDGRFLVAKQHPNGNRAITNYYIIDRQKDSPIQDPSAAVIGPLGEAEYLQRKRELHLPAFSKAVKSLQ